jgi:hypothetical protein
MTQPQQQQEQQYTHPEKDIALEPMDPKDVQQPAEQKQEQKQGEQQQEQKQGKQP